LPFVQFQFHSRNTNHCATDQTRFLDPLKVCKNQQLRKHLGQSLFQVLNKGQTCIAQTRRLHPPQFGKSGQCFEPKIAIATRFKPQTAEMCGIGMAPGGCLPQLREAEGKVLFYVMFSVNKFPPSPTKWFAFDESVEHRAFVILTQES
jgi:hypothetical protein